MKFNNYCSLVVLLTCILSFINVANANDIDNPIEHQNNQTPMEYDHTHQYLIDYNNDAYDLSFDIKGYAIIGHGKQKNLPTPTIDNPKPTNKFISSGEGVSISTRTFLNDNFGAMVSLGVEMITPNHTSIQNVFQNYNQTLPNKSKKKIYSIPLTVGMQLQLPLKNVTPFIGASYYYSYLWTRSKDIFNIKNANGAAFQAGINILMPSYEHAFITISVEKRMMNTRVKYGGTTDMSSISSKVKLDPMNIGIGIGLRL
ncbi:MAG: OmpW family outer membrane protein [Rickettsiaceae bacterium]